MMQFLLASIVLLCASITLTAQSINITGWRTLSSLTTVLGADRARDGAIWAVTSGGVIRVDLQSRSTTEYRNVNALQTLDCTSLICDRSNGTH
jgi:hypothetical protein